MSARPDPYGSSLSSDEGQLVCVRISVEPRLLEDLLEALAEVSFPVNPQIYHHSSVAYVYPDGRQDVDPAAIVEFPAYSGRLPEVETVLERHGFSRHSLRVRRMIDEVHPVSQVVAAH